MAELVEGGGLENVPTSVVLRVFYRLASSGNGIHGIIRACSPFNVQLNMQPTHPLQKTTGHVRQRVRDWGCNCLASTIGREDRLATVGVTPFSERLAGTPKTCEVASEGAGKYTGSGANQARSYWISRFLGERQ